MLITENFSTDCVMNPQFSSLDSPYLKVMKQSLVGSFMATVHAYDGPEVMDQTS